MNPYLAAYVEELLLVVVLQVPKVVVLPRRQLVGDLVGKDDGRADLGQLHAQDGARVGRRVAPRVGRRPDLGRNSIAIPSFRIILRIILRIAIELNQFRE